MWRHKAYILLDIRSVTAGLSRPDPGGGLKPPLYIFAKDGAPCVITDGLLELHHDFKRHVEVCQRKNRVRAFTTLEVLEEAAH